MSRVLTMVQMFYPHITKVQDGKRSLVIEVTEEDSELSDRKHHKQCALARACRQAAAVDGVIVSRSMIFLLKGTTAVRYELTGAAKQQVARFDKGLGFAPGTYKLHVPCQSHRLGVTHPRELRGGVGSPHRPRVMDMQVRAALGSGRRVFA